jgi:hypothetical protein
MIKQESTKEKPTNEKDQPKITPQEDDIYPLRKPSEDPRWAVRTVWIWITIALSSLAFILIMLILGIFYD